MKKEENVSVDSLQPPLGVSSVQNKVESSLKISSNCCLRIDRLCCCSKRHSPHTCLLPPPHTQQQDISVQWSGDIRIWGLWKDREKKNVLYQNCAPSLHLIPLQTKRFCSWNETKKDCKYKDMNCCNVTGQTYHLLSCATCFFICCCFHDNVQLDGQHVGTNYPWHLKWTIQLVLWKTKIRAFPVSISNFT